MPQTPPAEPLTGDDDDDATEPQGSPASIGLTPDQVRNSPEYKALAKQARADARARGTLASQLATARGETETARAAAEAQAREAQDAAIRAALGDDGIERWAQIADLSASDPVAAAKAFADFGNERAQSLLAAQQAGAAAAATTDTTPKGTAVTGSSGTPPPPPGQGRTVGASAPLGTPAQPDGWDAVIAASKVTVDNLAARNADPLTRNRVTMKERGAGLIAFLAAGYAEHFRDKGRQAR